MAIRKITPRTRLAGGIVVLAYGGFALWLGVSLLSRGMSAAGAAWLLWAIFFLMAGIAALWDISPRDDRPRVPVGSVHVYEERRMGDLIELMRSNNVVEVGAAKALLEGHGVTAHLLDAHGSAVLGSLPGMNVRLLVPRSDIVRSLEILRSTPEGGNAAEST